MPAFSSLHSAQRPVEEVAHVSEDFGWLATAAIEASETVWSAFESPGGAIGHGRESVTEEIAFFVHAGTIAQEDGMPI